MSRIRRNLLVLSAAALAGGGLAESQASADSIRIGGSVSVRARGHVRIGTPRRHHAVRHVRVRPRVRYYPGMYLGVTFAQPPPPPRCYDDCGHVHAHYTAPSHVVVEPPPPPPPQATPTFGLGLFAGPVDVDGYESTDLGLIGRLRLSHHLRLEAEVSKSEFQYSDRLDRRLGAALMYDFSPTGQLAPYLLGGLGVGRSEFGDTGVGADLAYGEVGIGLEWRVTDKLSLIGDIRAGQAESRMDDDDVVLLVVPETSFAEESEYLRGRLGGVLYF